VIAPEGLKVDDAAKPEIGDEQVSLISNADTCFGVAAVLSEHSGEAAEIVPNWECRKARLMPRDSSDRRKQSTASQFEALVAI
jgi:hypothetical protein